MLRARLPVLGSVLGNALLFIVHGDHAAAVLHLLVVLLLLLLRMPLLLLLLLLLWMPLRLLGLLVSQTGHAEHVHGTGLGVCVLG